MASIFISVLILLFTALVILLGVIFLVMESLDRIEAIHKRAPWLRPALESRTGLVTLLLLCAVLSAGDAYELWQKEFPEIKPPQVTFRSPQVQPVISVTSSRPQQRNQVPIDLIDFESIGDAIFQNNTEEPVFILDIGIKFALGTANIPINIQIDSGKIGKVKVSSGTLGTLVPLAVSLSDTHSWGDIYKQAVNEYGENCLAPVFYSPEQSSLEMAQKFHAKAGYKIVVGDVEGVTHYRLLSAPQKKQQSIGLRVVLAQKKNCSIKQPQ